MSGVGLTTPKLLPVTALWATPFSVYFTLLSLRVVRLRLQTEHYIGNRLPSSEKKEGPNSSDFCPLEIATRAHGNFYENVPLGLFLLAVAELNGGDRRSLHVAAATLFALRLAHVEGGLNLEGKFGGNGIGRPLGYFGTCGWLVGVAGYASWLVRDYFGY